ncbi:MAG TPA: putative Ig domain-containing protein [Bryobacteraceae bacterium]|nr:putative Ig domain-containing protein [Bryobacteraceae bacterium]
MLKNISIFAVMVCLPALSQSTSNGITLTPSAMTINYQIGAATLPAAQTMQVQTTPKGLNFTVSVSGSPFNAAWLLVSETAGVSPGTLKVEANPTGLPAGAYAATITVSATSGSTTYTQSATVTLMVASAAASISASPASLSFTYVTGTSTSSPSLTSAFVLSSSGSAMPATVSVKSASWLSVTPSGNVTLLGLLNTISVSVNPTGLTPKVYTGQITISAPNATNKTLTVTVTLTVNAAVPTTTSTWPAGVIQGSPETIVTVNGSGYFSNSTVYESGFTPASTITVTDGTSTVSSTFYIPVYQTTTDVLRLGVASPLPSGTVGVAYTQPLAGGGGTSPYTYAITGGLAPAGLTISGSNLAGTPTAAGTFQFIITVTDSETPPASASFPITMTIAPSGATALSITSAAAPLPPGVVGSAYGPVTLTATGGTGGPYTWSATNLPAGMTLSSAGALAGSPTTDGSNGALAASIVSSESLLATVPATDLAQAGLMRMEVQTPPPGGGTSNEAQFAIYGPEPQITAVVNSASYAQGTLAPGDIIAIFGLGLGPSTLTVFDPTAATIATSLPATGSATSVTINGTAAPILYTSATALSVIVPYTTAGASAQVVVTYGGLSSQAFTVAVASADPGIYSMASSGQGQGAILNFDPATGNYTVNSNAQPAAAGSEVILYITGAGATSSTVDNQLIPASPAVTPTQTPSVSIGGQGATLLGAQAPIGSIPGLMQVNVTVPSGLKASPAVPVIVTIGGVQSQTGLTMAVK